MEKQLSVFGTSKAQVLQKRCSKVISKVISKRFWWFVSGWKNTNFMENLLYFFFLVSQVTVDYKYHVLLGVEIKNKNVL